LTLAVIALVTVFLARELSHHMHDVRRDKLIGELTDKIKARDYTEYAEQKRPAPLFAAVSNDDEDLYHKEIEQNKV
jgi:hypothetical protein